MRCLQLITIRTAIMTRAMQVKCYLVIEFAQIIYALWKSTPDLFKDTEEDLLMEVLIGLTLLSYCDTHQKFFVRLKISTHWVWTRADEHS